ncbi:MAG: DUF4912 domain-containing protein [Planctomycetaceae bacterium]|nr:DUF4912 domain-containing protein [Planctomycetaceae bacterium]
MTAADLKTRTVRDLASMAKKSKVRGWHAMTKDELVKALARRAKATPRSANGNGRQSNGAEAGHETAPAVSERLARIQAKLAEAKDLAFHSVGDEETLPKDRLIVMVRDPYWLHAYWELSRKAVERAKVALGQHWHGAQPVLRVYEVPHDGTTTSARHPIRDVDIHGGVQNWYIDVQNPPKTYQLDIGYRGGEDKFFCLARSNVVTTPPASEGETFDRNWVEVAKDCDRIFALSGGYTQPEANGELKEVLEERLQRPVGDPTALQFGPGAAGPATDQSGFDFQVDTELIVHGVTDPDAHVTLRGEPVRLRSDGSFAVRFNLPDRRHVLPVVASSRDGAQQRTIVLAVDRNTKVMEPVTHDAVE